MGRRGRGAAGLLTLGAVVAPGTASASGVDWIFQNNHSKMCMSVRNASQSAGAVVDQFPCDPNRYPDQVWQVRSLDAYPGYDYIVNLNSLMCLSVPNASMTIGTGLDQWPCGNFPDQAWYIPNGGNPGVIVNYRSNACVSVPNASTQALVQLDQWVCDEGAYLDQTWNPVLPQVIIGDARGDRHGSPR